MLHTKLKKLNITWRVSLLMGGSLLMVLVLTVLLYNLQINFSRTSHRNVVTYAPRLPLPPKPYTFPDGGRQLFPNYRFVALYGSPNMPGLGALGEQPVDQTITRLQQLVAQYQSYSTEPIMPTFEIIATVASAYPTNNNDYSQEVDPALIQAWISAARQANMYVVLDLQSGRTDFLTQAKQYQALLEQPNVGLALDPEWRLAPNQVPIVQIGTVGIAEINATGQWLSDLTAQHKLPQKLFLLHQFRTDMIQNRELLDTSHMNLAYAIQMDGSGSQPSKLDTWQTILAGAPAAVHFGWKNFYTQDPVTLDPASTMAITPKPWYVSYQ